VTAEVVPVELLDTWVRRFGDLVAEQRAYLTELDSAIGDADHGVNMDRGMRAVCDKLDADSPGAADELFKLVGMTLVSSVGGASGPLYGTFFLRLGTACGHRDAIPVDDLAKAFRAGVEGLVSRGRPELGDKTMFDAMQPALEALDASVAEGSTASEAFASAWRASVEGRDATIPMVARKGRASYLGERSAGHQDPGATSSALLFEAAADAFAAHG
jgi:phosphoenolpyruvate---glycerone phosphotransferase subunit DhaL